MDEFLVQPRAVEPDLAVLAEWVAVVRRQDPRGGLVEPAGTELVERRPEFRVERRDERGERVVQPLPRGGVGRVERTRRRVGPRRHGLLRGSWVRRIRCRVLSTRY